MVADRASLVRRTQAHRRRLALGGRRRQDGQSDLLWVLEDWVRGWPVRGQRPRLASRWSARTELRLGPVVSVTPDAALLVPAGRKRSAAGLYVHRVFSS